jgi:lipocalin
VLHKFKYEFFNYFLLLSEIVLLVALAILLPSASSQVTSRGRCPKFSVFEEVDLQRYLGTWYQVQAFPTFFTQGLTCIKAQYGVSGNGTISVLNTAKKPNGENYSILGSAVVVSPGKLLVSFPFSPRKKKRLIILNLF